MLMIVLPALACSMIEYGSHTKQLRPVQPVLDHTARLSRWLWDTTIGINEWTGDIVPCAAEVVRYSIVVEMVEDTPLTRFTSFHRS
jgi:hypothetical protein